VEELEGGRHLLQPLRVRHVAAHLHREEEAGRALVDPACDGLDTRQPVERRVDLDRVEESRVVLEPAPRRQARRVEDRIAPVLVVPAGAAYAESAAANLSHSSGVPAATTRARASRSSGASRKGDDSTSSIASPRS